MSVVSRITDQAGLTAYQLVTSSSAGSPVAGRGSWPSTLSGLSCRSSSSGWTGLRRLAPRQVVVRRLRAPLGHQRVAALLADRARRLGIRVVDVAEEARARRAGHARRRACAPPSAASRRRCGRRTACTSSSPSAARRSRARRTGRPTSSTCSRCTCRSRPARCRPRRACSSRRSGTPARTAGSSQCRQDLGKCTVSVFGNSPTSKVCTRLKNVPVGSAP